MIWATATLRLASDPMDIATKTGVKMASGFGFADIQSHEGLALAIVGFGSIADELLRYRKGNSIHISGRIQANNYTNRDGEDVKRLQVVLDGIAGMKRSQPVQAENDPQARIDGSNGSNADPPRGAF